MKYCKTKNSCD